METLQSIMTRMQSTPKEEPKTESANNLDLLGFQAFNDPELIKLASEASKFASDCVTGRFPHWLTILGPCGVGKSHIANALLAYWRNVAGWQYGPYKSLGDYQFLSWIRYISRRRDREPSELVGLTEKRFLVIDDIGTSKDSDFAREKLYELLDRREKKWTVITSNLTMQELTQIDTRIPSRMTRHGSVVVEVKTTDFGLRMGSETHANQ